MGDATGHGDTTGHGVGAGDEPAVVVGAGAGTEMVPAAVGAGRYRLGSLIGRGASCEVFRAQDTVLGRAVAIKLFPPGATGPDQARRRREARTLAGLDHPRLVTVYDVGEDRGRSFFVLQLIEGPSLAARLADGPLTVGRPWTSGWEPPPRWPTCTATG